MSWRAGGGPLYVSFGGGKVFTIPGPVLNYGGPDTGGAQFMLVPPPKNPGYPIFGVDMPHTWFGGDALNVKPTIIVIACKIYRAL